MSLVAGKLKYQRGLERLEKTNIFSKPKTRVIIAQIVSTSLFLCKKDIKSLLVFKRRSFTWPHSLR